ncbi:hypothetical protein LguiA_009810 [Lonicera macranthoides]
MLGPTSSILVEEEGFGLNVVSLVLIAVLGFTKRTVKANRRISLPGKVLLYLLPALGTCMACIDILLLLKETLSGYSVVYHEWLLRCSQLSLWATILLVSSYGYWFILFNWILCLWWIVKPLLGIPHLLTAFSSLEALICVKESFAALVGIMFGILVNVIRIKEAYLRNSSTEEPLLSCQLDIEGGHRDHGFAYSFWNMLTFKSIASVMECGATKQLDFEDLLQLPVDLDPSSCNHMLLNCWQAQQRNDFAHPSLFRAICCAYGWPYFRLGLLKVLNDCIGFAGPLLLNKLIRFLQQGSKNFDGYILAVSLGLTSILKSFLDTQYTFHLAKLKLKLRSSIMTAIFRKCLFVSLAERSKFSEGEIQTFMSVDADRTVNLCNSFHDMWSLPLQIGVALYLLYTQVKFAFVSGLAITILLIPVNKWIAELIANATKNMMAQKDERIRKTGELLMYIRTLKMYGWELLFASWLMKTRSSEVTHLSTRKYLDAWCVFFWATTPTLFSFCTFGLYVLMGNQLDAATVFTCLALFNNLISPLNSFPWVINGLIDAIISTRRLTKFLSCSENGPQKEQIEDSSSSYHSNQQSDFSYEEMAVVITDACCAWASSSQDDLELVLDHVTLALPRGSFVAVVGEVKSVAEVGSGKSSLLYSILGETRLINGSIYSSGSVAYVPQVPWILSGTIRDNILFGKDYDPERYSIVLEACALDIDVSLMVGGDMAYIGEKGLNLSGGQRARLALARAVYNRADIFMLDDVLSAVDAQVARWILSNAILSPLVNQHTRVLCTHNIQAISSADLIIVMDRGRVKWVGSPADSSVSSFVKVSSSEEFNISSQVQRQEISTNNYTEDQQKLLLESDGIHVSEEAQVIIEVELRKEGRVEPTVYKNYAAFSGWFISIVTCLSAILMQASRNGNDMWLSYWVDSTGTYHKEHSTSFYLIILCVFAIINSLLTLVRAFSFAFGGLRAAVQVHDRLLNKLVDAPVNFFDQTPTGRILNRLSSDLYTIDDSLPFILNILLANFVGLLGIVVVLSYVQVIFLLLLLPFWSTSRELRRLDSVSRSPIYASFTETLDGSSTIRAFKSEIFRTSDFVSEDFLFRNKCKFVAFPAPSAFIVSFIAVMAIVGSHGRLPISLGTPGLVGLALSYAAPIVSLLGSFLTSFTETEKEMVSIERVLQADILATVQNQIGIVGRTGAGKSSILNALFRLNPICGGRILVDGINIADVSVRDLRSHFAVVPQTSFLFSGSLRDNLDPFRVNDELKIWEALEKCHVDEEVKAAGGLDIHVKEFGTSFSVGQRQLLCLARAFLKSSKVLCLDECTANVDTETASKLQEAIATECRGMTMITIAHRISTVLNMDSILILDQGTLVEQGNPQALLKDELSRFSSFATASGI